MKGILEDFMSLGKLEEGLIKTNMEKVSPGEIDEDIHNVIVELEVILKPGQKISCKNGVHHAAWVDRKLLKSIFINLISNAIKFSGDNSVITISSDLTNDYLSIQITDNGIGISEDDQIHLFERFFRAKNAANIPGTGLGLHIVKKYLDLMNGRIEVSSKLNEGTVFKIYIPQNFQS
jgi:signal transduction histidine kinase